ncbi:MAG: hypothetical protein AAB695_01145 [Patescibacteria group bacterium]
MDPIRSKESEIPADLHKASRTSNGMDEENKSKVGELDETLYSRTRYKEPLGKRPPVKNVEAPSVEEKWQGPGLDEILSRERLIPPTHPFMKKFFIFALLFFVATIFVAGLIFLGGTNFISSKNVEVNIVGPTSASAGEVLELGLTVKNSNNSDLELVKLSVQYPTGTRNPDNTGESLTFTKEDLGVIPAGEEVAKSVRMVLIGSSEEVKEIKFSVEYHVKGSNATFYKDKLYEITIGSAPVSIYIQSPTTVTSGEDFTTTLTLIMNSTEPLKNVMLKAEYPYGYSALSAVPEAIANDNVWALGDFSPGRKAKVTLQGRLTGENQEERTFRFYVGVSDNGSMNPDFKSVVVSRQHTIEIARPSIDLSATFNGDNSPVYIAPAERAIATSIRFQNNLSEKILNPKLEMRLSGGALDKSSVSVQNNGFYDSANNRITWNLINALGSSELLPGQGGVVTASFASLPQAALAGTNSDISLVFSLSAIPGAGSQPVSISESRTVKIASQVTLSSKDFYSIGPFRNTGPIPPQVGKETTYTILWNVGNTQNDISQAKVTARLGPGVRFLVAGSVASENISYDQSSNTVTWDMGELSSGSGFSSSGRETAFQVGLTPSVSQIGTAPTLVTGIVFTGIDTLSGNTVTVTSPPMTTRLTNDPAFIQGNDIVVK